MNPYDKLLARLHSMTKAAERGSRKKGRQVVPHPEHAEAHRQAAKAHHRKKARRHPKHRKGHGR